MKLFKKGNRDGLTMEDMYAPLAPDESKGLTNELEKCVIFFIS